MASLTLDLSQFQAGIIKANEAVKKAMWSSILDVSNEILRLSQSQVPHDVGTLQNSGRVEPHPREYAEVGYNTPYAARLHENPQFRFQKGRKGKYLEDPIKDNLETFKGYYQENIKKALG
jgi:hypothetical protein